MQFKEKPSGLWHCTYQIKHYLEAQKKKAPPDLPYYNAFLVEIKSSSTVKFSWIHSTLFVGMRTKKVIGQQSSKRPFEQRQDKLETCGAWSMQPDIAGSHSSIMHARSETGERSPHGLKRHP